LRPSFAKRSTRPSSSGPVVVLVEFVARVHDGRLELDDLDRARRVVQRDAPRRDPAREPDERDALGIRMERERQVRDEELRRHVDRRARVDLAVVGEPHVAARGARHGDDRREPFLVEQQVVRRHREVQHRLAVVLVDVARVLVHPAVITSGSQGGFFQCTSATAQSTAIAQPETSIQWTRPRARSLGDQRNERHGHG
jgi:hypothetical protein